jgi:SfnB family sulfur acquisition oxidoreductase
MTELDASRTPPRPARRKAPKLDDAAAIGAARELALIFAEGAAERDRDRVVPYGQIDDLSRSGLLAITVPESFGGSDVSPRTLAEVIRILAAADPSVAQIPHSHYVYVNLLRVAGTPEQQRFFFGEVLSGGVLGRAESEPGAAGGVDARLTRSEPGLFRLNGHKDHCTGAIFATWIPTLARLDDGTPDGGEELIAFVDRRAAGITVVDDWGGMGQRTTASGSIAFDGVAVPADHIIRRAKALDRPRGYGAFAQLLHSAVEVGIAGGVLAEAAAFVRAESRPPSQGGAGYRAQDDPTLLQRFGELTVDVRAAEAVLAAAAVAVEKVLESPSPESATEASLAVATAKVVGERAALNVTNGIFEVGGPAASLQSLNLHRHWRNARTHTLYDPIRRKFQHLGRSTLLGISPPRYEQI